MIAYRCRQEFVQMFLDAVYLGCINLQEEFNYKGDQQIV